MHAQAEMGADAERQVRVGVPGDVEGLRVVEDLVVAVGRRVDHRHLVARRDRLARHLGVDHRGAPEIVQRVGPAQHFLDHCRYRIRVPAHRRHLLRMLQQGEQPARQHGAGGVVAGRHQLHEEAAEVHIGHQPPVETAAEQDVGQVPLGRHGPPAGREPHRVQGHLHAGGAPLGLLGDVGVLAPGVALRQPMDGRPVLGGQPEQLADDRAGQVSAHVVDELHLAARAGVVEYSRGDGPDLVLHLPDDPRLELRRHRFAVGGVAGRVHGQEHVAHGFEARRIEVLDDHAPLGCREHLGMAGHLDHVGVAQHRPVASLARHLLPAHGALAAEAGEEGVRRSVLIEVRRVDVDGGVGHEATCGEGGPGDGIGRCWV